jgi:CBS domain-containing protein
MRHYLVRDVMTADPVTVTPATSVKDLADILITQRVGAVPVLTVGGKVAGIVTATDLLRKEELQRNPEGQHSMHLTYRARRAIATAETAREVMGTHPATVRADATVAEAARVMDRQQVTCLLVTDQNSRLLGMVSPRDLLRVFLRPDEQIRAEIISEVLAGYFGTNPALVQVDVTDGVVRLTGELERKSMLALIQPAVRAVDGVIDVEARLGYAIDDARLIWGNWNWNQQSAEPAGQPEPGSKPEPVGQK